MPVVFQGLSSNTCRRYRIRVEFVSASRHSALRGQNFEGREGVLPDLRFRSNLAYPITYSSLEYSDVNPYFGTAFCTCVDGCERLLCTPLPAPGAGPNQYVHFPGERPAR